MRVLGVALAGALGAVSRYGLDVWVSERTRHPFPWGILIVNLSGSFLVGVVFALLEERFPNLDPWRVPVTAGFLGAFTTFSTFTFQTVNLAEDRMFMLAALNVLVSVVGGLLAAWFGTVVGRAVS
jgi:CrcB protein